VTLFANLSTEQWDRLVQSKLDSREAWKKLMEPTKGYLTTDIMLDEFPVYVGPAAEFTVFCNPKMVSSSLAGLTRLFEERKRLKEQRRANRGKQKTGGLSIRQVGNRKAYVMMEDDTLAAVEVRGRNARTGALLVTFVDTQKKAQFLKAVLLSDSELSEFNDTCARREILLARAVTLTSDYQVYGDRNLVRVSGLPPEVVVSQRANQVWHPSRRFPLQVSSDGMLTVTVHADEPPVTGPSGWDLCRRIGAKLHPQYGKMVYVLSNDWTRIIAGPVSFLGSVDQHIPGPPSYSVIILGAEAPVDAIVQAHKELEPLNLRRKQLLSKAVEIPWIP
jgi:hypothetical protein